MWVKVEDKLPPEFSACYRVIRRGRGQKRREDKLWWMKRDNAWGWYNLMGQKIEAVEEWMEVVK